MTCLRRLPVGYVKIDRHLVAGLGSDWTHMATVNALVGAGHAFELTTVAAGVESAEQRRLLVGFSLGQGFHFVPPQPLKAVIPIDDPDRPS